ncbi:MAG: hypothetical protein VYD94_03390 [Thermoproteota archaeon]|nr:hypothetical protein [Thermoproteota archaeon]
MLSFKEQQAESFITEEWNSAAIDVAADYFLDEGINEEGIDLIVEEVGLEDFVEYILDPPSEDLMEERSAKKAAASAPSYEKVKAKVDAGDAARKKAGKGEYAKTAAAKRNYGDEDNTNYDDKPAAKKKTVAKAKTAPKPKAKPKVVEIKKKVEKSVPKAKAKQPDKKATKKGLLSKIGDTVKKGVERHQKAVGDAKAAYKKQRAKGKVPEKRAKEFAAGVKSGVKTAVKFAKDVKKTVSEEAYDHYKDRTLERRRIEDYKTSKPSTGRTARKDDQEKSRKAFQNVVKNLRARYGDDSVLTNKTNESVDLQELSSDTLRSASQAADKDRGKKAAAGDREGAKKRVAQASKFYAASAAKRKAEGKTGANYSEEYEVTNADKKGNTPAYQAYKAGKKNAKTGKPLYKAAAHMKEGCASESTASDAAKKEAVLKNKEDKKVAEKKAAAGIKESRPPGYWDYHEKEGLKRFTDFIQEGNPTSRMMHKSSTQTTGNISADRGSDVKKNRESRKGLEKDLKKKGIGYKKGTGEYKYDDGSKGREVSYQTSPAKGMSKRKFGKVMRRLGRKHGQESVITKDKNKPARLHDTESKKPGKSVNIGKTKPGKHPDGAGETSGTKVRSNKLSKKTNKPSYHYG